MEGLRFLEVQFRDLVILILLLLEVRRMLVVLGMLLKFVLDIRFHMLKLEKSETS